MDINLKSKIRVLLADDHPLFLSGVRTLLEQADDMSVVGEAASGTQALRMIGETRPNVAVLDMTMPGLNGIAIAQDLAELGLQTRVIILSAHEDWTYPQQALRAGAQGYVLKRSTCDCLLQAIRAVQDGGLYLDPIIAKYFVPGAGRVPTRAVGPGPLRLTEREHEVLRLIALGFSSKEVAGKLGVTAKSVETYKLRASEKLNIRTRSKIVEYGMMQGWFQSSVPQ